MCRNDKAGLYVTAGSEEMAAGQKTTFTMYLWHDLAKKEHPQLYGSRHLCWPGDVALLQELTGHLLQVTFTMSCLETEALVDFTWWAFDQIHLSRQCPEILHAALSSDECKIRRNISDLSSHPEITEPGLGCQSSFQEEQCSGRSVGRRLPSSCSFTIPPLVPCSWGSESILQYANK